MTLQEKIDAYEERGTNKNLKRYFAANREKAINKLDFELRMLGILPAPSAPPTTNAKPNTVPPPSTQASDPLGAQARISSQKESIIKEMATLMAERAKLSNSLHDFAPADDTGRKDVVSQIDRLTDTISSLMNTEKHIVAHGELPKAKHNPTIKDIETLSITELIDYRNNLRTRLSKAKAALKDLSESDTRYTEQMKRMKEWNLIILSIETKLK